jgi:hypothetical protein
MTELIVCVTDNIGNNHIKDLIEKNNWGKVFILTNEKMAIEFSPVKEVNMVIIDPSQPTENIVKDIMVKLKGNLSGFEVALNLFSGNGKEHMAILSALIKLGFGIRLVKQGKNGFEEI